MDDSIHSEEQDAVGDLIHSEEKDENGEAYDDKSSDIFEIDRESYS